jgi:hypothetical protein
MREGDDREVEVGGAPGRKESSKARGCVVYASPRGAPLYRGEGVPYPSTKAPGATPKEEEKGDGA